MSLRYSFMPGLSQHSGCCCAPYDQSTCAADQTGWPKLGMFGHGERIEECIPDQCYSTKLRHVPVIVLLLLLMNLLLLLHMHMPLLCTCQLLC